MSQPIAVQDSVMKALTMFSKKGGATVPIGLRGCPSPVDSCPARGLVVNTKKYAGYALTS